MQFNGQRIGHDQKPLVIAEISANHLGSLDRCIDLVFKAQFIGTDACKLQIYSPERLALRRGGSLSAVCNEAPWTGRTFFDLYQEAHTPREWYPQMQGFHSCLFASVFDKEDVDYLEPFDPPAYKIASREAADIDLVTHAAKTGKPLIISTGTATEEQLGKSIAAASKHTNQIAILYCVSEYPTDPSKIDFDEIGALRHRFGLPVGFSDHTLGVESSVEAVKHGACIIEKHLTLSRSDGGPDAAFSLEPKEFADLVQKVKHAN